MAMPSIEAMPFGRMADDFWQNEANAWRRCRGRTSQMHVNQRLLAERSQCVEAMPLLAEWPVLAGQSDIGTAELCAIPGYAFQAHAYAAPRSSGPNSQISGAHFRSKPGRFPMPGAPAMMEHIEAVGVGKRKGDILLGEQERQRMFVAQPLDRPGQEP